MRLIDADALAKNGWVLERHGVSNTLIGRMSIADVPTIEAEPVKHGRWIEHIDHEMLTGYDECSVCHFGTIGQSNYCPNCGAKMDGGEADA